LSLVFSNVALFFFSFKRISAYLGENISYEPEFSQSEEEREKSNQIALHIKLVSKNVPWETACYPQALAGKIILRRRGIASTLFLGARKDEQGMLKGHAWLKAQGIVVTGKIGHQKFNIIAIYT
jgi:hypothetical protein